MGSAPKILSAPPTPGRPVKRGSLRAWLWPESGAVNPIPALDGLRAVAALMVILSHAWTFVPGTVQPGHNPLDYPLYYTRSGVQLFYVLSGFLLFLPYAQWLFGLRPRPATLLFYKRRILRVGPAYWVSLVILVLAAPLTGAAIKDMAIHLVFLSNISWKTVFSINGVYWTMAIEVQFYVMLALIAWAMYALAKKAGLKWASFWVFCVLGVISVVSHVLTYKGPVRTISVVSTLLLNNTSMPYWLSTFGCGILCAIGYVHLTKVVHLKKSMVQRLPGICTRIFILGLALSLGLFFWHWLQSHYLSDLLYGPAYTGLLVGVLLGAAILRKPFESKVMRFAGLVSYSCYIWHPIVLHALEPRLRFLQQDIVQALGPQAQSVAIASEVIVLFILGSLGSTALAYISYQCVERLFINARKQAHEKVDKPSQKQATQSMPQQMNPYPSGAPSLRRRPLADVQFPPSGLGSAPPSLAAQRFDRPETPPREPPGEAAPWAMERRLAPPGATSVSDHSGAVGGNGGGNPRQADAYRPLSQQVDKTDGSHPSGWVRP